MRGKKAIVYRLNALIDENKSESWIWVPNILHFAKQTILGTKYRLFRKVQDIRNPDPTLALVFIDESVESVDDGFFATHLEPNWMNSPTVRHSRGAVFSFADGHGERWGWRGLNSEQDWFAPATGPGVNSLADLHRLWTAIIGM